MTILKKGSIVETYKCDVFRITSIKKTKIGDTWYEGDYYRWRNMKPYREL